MFKIIITESVYDQILKEKRPDQSNLRKLLQLEKARVTKIDQDATTHILHNKEEVLKNPSALYILNITSVDALDIQRSYGVMCLSHENPNITPLIDINDVHVSSVGKQLGSGWETVVNSIRGLPSNALLITDRYLFASKYKRAGNGFDNVHDILSQLMPIEFNGGEYHITIVFDKTNIDPDYKFSAIAAELQSQIHELRHYPIMLEVLGITPKCDVYNDLHNRLIVSNYYFVEASHKLAAFNQKYGTAHQTLLPVALFTESSLNQATTHPLYAIDQTIATFINFSDSSANPLNQDKYFFALNGKKKKCCFSLRNRLLQKQE